MAVYTKIDDSKPVNRARAVIQRVPSQVKYGTVLEIDVPHDGMPDVEDVLDERFLVGGTTTWERPAASGS